MSYPSLLPLLLLSVVASSSAAIFRVGNGNCGGLGCDFGAFSLNDAINATRDGDVIELYGQIFVSSDFPTPAGFPDTILSVLTSITIAGISDGLLTPSIQIVSPGTQGLNLFTLAAPGIELVDFPINRQIVKNVDNNPDVATVRIRNCFNGTCSPADNILLTNIAMQQDEPFLGSDVLIENGTYSGIRLLGGVFRAAIGVNINETAQLSGTLINENRFLFSAYNNNNPAAKVLSAVDLRMNFWRPCPYRGPGLILPELGVDDEDTWWPYCVDSQCEIPGPIATQNGSSDSYEGWLTIQDALLSSQPDPLTVAVTAPFFEINSTQIIYRRILLTSVVQDCVTPCFANGTNPTVLISNNGGSTATIGFVVLGRLLSASNLQFELEDMTRLAVYRRVQPYNASVFEANRGPLAFGSIAFTAVPALQASLNSVLTTDYAAMFPVSSGGDMTLTNLQIRRGQQGILFWGPNKLSVEPLAELLVQACLFDEQVDFGVYMAGPNFQPRLESDYFGGSSTSYGLLAEKLNDIELFRNQIIEVGTGVALSQVNSSLLDCNACVDASDFCISVQASEGNVAKWNTFAVANNKRFSRMPDNSDTLAVQESINLGQVMPQLRVFQQFSSPDFPYLFAGPPMFTQSDDVLRRHNTTSMTDGTQNASSSLFLKSIYLPTRNLDCYNYRDSLSSIYSAYSNVRDDCSLHSLRWDPFDNSSLGCDALIPIVQRIPDFEWQQRGNSMSSGQDCILTSENTTQNVRFAVGTVTMRNAFVCVACDGDLAPFDNKTCDFMVGSFQQAMEQVRVSQLEDATILVNGICFVFNEDIDVQGLTIENCGQAILSPTQGLPSAMMLRDVMETEAEYQLRITVNFTTIQGIIFQAVGDNTTYANTYCVIFIDGELLPIFNTTIFNNSFLQPNVDHLCTLMDTFTNVSSNRFRDSRVSVRMSADSNAVVPQVSGVNRYSENSFENGIIHMFYTFQAPIRRPTAPYSRLQVMDNSFVNPRDVSLDVLGISGRRTRMDLLFERNEYTNPTPDSAACQPGNMDPTICCEDTKGCDTAAQRFVDSEDALFDNERYFGGAIMQMAGRNVRITNGRWRDKSAAVVGNSELALLQNAFSPKNVTIDGANFAKDATIVCNLGRSFDPATGRDGMLMARNTVINGQNIGVSKDDCDQTLIGIFTANCVDRQGREIFSARNTAPFEAREFIDPVTRVRTNCSGDLVYIPSQQGGTGSCNCEFLPEDQFIAVVPFIPPITSGSMTLRNVEQQEMINSEVQNCPTGQIHNPSNRSQCIEGTATSTPQPTPTPTATPEPPTPSPRSPSSPSSDDGGVHHLWWLWVLIGAGIAIILIGIVIWAFISWRRRDKTPLEQKQLMSRRAASQRSTSTVLQQPQQVQQRRNPTNQFGGDGIRF